MGISWVYTGNIPTRIGCNRIYNQQKSFRTVWKCGSIPPKLHLLAFEKYEHLLKLGVFPKYSDIPSLFFGINGICRQQEGFNGPCRPHAHWLFKILESQVLPWFIDVRWFSPLVVAWKLPICASQIPSENVARHEKEQQEAATALVGFKRPRFHQQMWDMMGNWAMMLAFCVSHLTYWAYRFTQYFFLKNV